MSDRDDILARRCPYGDGLPGHDAWRLASPDDADDADDGHHQRHASMPPAPPAQAVRVLADLVSSSGQVIRAGEDAVITWVGSHGAKPTVEVRTADGRRALALWWQWCERGEP